MGDIAMRAEGKREAPTSPPNRRVLAEELLLVLALSLLPSAILAFLDLFRAPVNATQAVGTFPSLTNLYFLKTLTEVVFLATPVWLVVHLVRRSGEGTVAVGLTAGRIPGDVLRGVVVATVVGAAGAALYIAAVNLGVNRIVVPVPPLGYWWTVPLLILSAVANALLEEVVVVGYMLTRLRQIGWGIAGAVAASASLRGTYHLYQGWGGFTGNLAMGVLFALLFLRWRRTWPLVVAHTLLDVGAGVLWIAFDGRIPGIS